MRRQGPQGAAGFTLIEVVAVLAIIALVAGVFGVNLLRAYRSGQLQQAGATLAANLNRARGNVVNSSTPAALALAALSGNTGYTLNGTAYTLQGGMTLDCTSGCDTSPPSIVYQAPYGELNQPSGYILTLHSPASGVTDVQLRLVGVTGKVLLVRAAP